MALHLVTDSVCQRRLSDWPSAAARRPRPPRWRPPGWPGRPRLAAPRPG